MQKKEMGSISSGFALAALILAAILAGTFIWLSSRERISIQTSPGNNEQLSVIKQDKSDQARGEIEVVDKDWKTFQSGDKKLEFGFPSEKLKLSWENEKAVLKHSVPFRHTDPCDMRDGAKELPEIIDFEVKVQHIKKNLADAARANEPDFFVEDHLAQNTLKISPQYIDAVKFGNFSGYKITNSVEGCGEYVYYLVLDGQNTLRLSRSIVAELQPMQTDYRANQKIPGIIKPEEEEKLFEQIMSSLKFNGDDSSPSSQVVPE